MITAFSDRTLEPLQRDSEFILYRDVRARPGMLLLAPAQDDVSPLTLARLEHEYSQPAFGMCAADCDARRHGPAGEPLVAVVIRDAHGLRGSSVRFGRPPKLRHR